jgi:hypothetical protein
MTDMPIRPAASIAETPIRLGAAPLPLVEERIRVLARGGVALVAREQRFRNIESGSIEATLTFPVPVQATLHRLTARIGDRLLTAKARPRQAAREVYEAAIDDGRTAVLHEELVRGIHMLSIAHIPPGAEIAVTHGWIAALTPRPDGEGLLRIPVGVGDVYGESPFTDADDLAVSVAIRREALLEIDAGEARVFLGARPWNGESVRLALDAPIDIRFAGLEWEALAGRSAGGRPVRLSVTPDAGGDAPLDAAILVDRSGSMDNPLAARGTPTKHVAVIEGLREAARRLGSADRVELWQFDSEAERIGKPADRLDTALHRLGRPRGGTEIGQALERVLATSAARDILLITDGLSHNLDVQRLANTGRRFTVVLVGADSLEANVGRLAAFTGGDIMLATARSDAGTATLAAIASLRRPPAPFAREAWPLARAALHAGGALIEARWGEGTTDSPEPALAEALGAFAAAIALPRLSSEAATQVAADHGIVCHLTSLVLVDEAGEIQAGLPAQRKIPLMAPAPAVPPPPQASYPAPASASFRHPDSSPPRPGSPAQSRQASPGAFVDRLVDIFSSVLGGRGASQPPVEHRQSAPSLAGLAQRIDWGHDPEALRRGDFRGLAPEIAHAIAQAAQLPEVRRLARVGTSPRVLVLGLLARSLGGADRQAERIARAVLKGLKAEGIAAAMAALGLS